MFKYKGKTTGLSALRYAEKILRANQKTHWSDEKLDKLMAEEFGKRFWPMNNYRGRLRGRYGVVLPRYGKYRKPMKGLETFLCQMFKRNAREKKPDSVLLRQLNKAFPHRGHHHGKPYSINDLRGGYNRGDFGGKKHRSMCYGEDRTVRTYKEEGKRLQNEAIKQNWQNPEYRKKMSRIVKQWHKDNPEWSRQFMTAGHKAQRRSEPGCQELAVLKRLDGWFPGLLKSTGNTKVGSNYVGSRCPDYTFTDGQKKVIDFDGGGHRAYRTKTERTDEARRRRDYAAEGYRICFIRERELACPERLKAKIKKFAFV